MPNIMSNIDIYGTKYKIGSSSTDIIIPSESGDISLQESLNQIYQNQQSLSGITMDQLNNKLNDYTVASPPIVKESIGLIDTDIPIGSACTRLYSRDPYNASTEEYHMSHPTVQHIKRSTTAPDRSKKVTILLNSDSSPYDVIMWVEQNGNGYINWATGEFSDTQKDGYYPSTDLYYYTEADSIEIQLLSAFTGLIALEDIEGIENWKLSENITDLSSYFEVCQHLKNIDLSRWDTSNITNMNRMFHWCENLTEESIHTMDNWDISNVTDFTSVFGECITHPNWNGTWDDNGTFTPA